MNGFIILAVYAVIMLAATFLFARRGNGSEDFYVGDRKIAEETTVEYHEVETVDLYSHLHAVDEMSLSAYPRDTPTYP